MDESVTFNFNITLTDKLTPSVVVAASDELRTGDQFIVRVLNPDTNPVLNIASHLRGSRLRDVLKFLRVITRADIEIGNICFMFVPVSSGGNGMCILDPFSSIYSMLTAETISRTIPMLAERPLSDIDD